MMTSLGCLCGLGVDPPPLTPEQQAAVQAAINTALANQQLALASQLETQRRDERAQVMEWQAMQNRARAADREAELETQWVDGVPNSTVLLIAAGVAAVVVSAKKG
jgi:hypothetical protein